MRGGLQSQWQATILVLLVVARSFLMERILVAQRKPH